MTLPSLGTAVHLDPTVNAGHPNIRAGRVVGYGTVHPTAYRYHVPGTPPTTVVIVMDDNGEIGVWDVDRTLPDAT